jgi:hypothetical protein
MTPNSGINIIILILGQYHMIITKDSTIQKEDHISIIKLNLKINLIIMIESQMNIKTKPMLKLKD